MLYIPMTPLMCSCVNVCLFACYQRLHGAQCLLSNSLVPGGVLAADPADWAMHPRPVSLGSSAQSRMLPRLSDASLSSPAQSNLLALAWHNQCVCVCVCSFQFTPAFGHLSSLLPTSVSGLSQHGLAWFAGALHLALLSCQSRLTVTLITRNIVIFLPHYSLFQSSFPSHTI